MLPLKILVAEKELLHYRVPFFNLLSERVEKLTVCHSGKKINDDVKFEQILISKRKLKSFVIQPKLRSLAKEYDVVITKFDMRWLSMISLSLSFTRKYKIIHWGIGVTSDNGFDINHSKDSLRYFFAKKCDALIFYSDYPVNKYVKNGISRNKLFVANNTVHVPFDDYIKDKGEYLLFIGSIHKRKRIEDLLEALVELRKRNIHIPLKIVGAGNHLPVIKDSVDKLHLEEVEFTGMKTGRELSAVFSNAIATVSPGQAGLAVLESMAYGVPFITNQDAITGGERLNIINGYNGFLYEESTFELSKYIEKIYKDKNLQETMSKNASKYYIDNRQMKFMVESFEKAIRYCTEKE